jgi:hypothetical protein
VISVVTMIILLYCVVNGTKILNIFNPSGEGVMESYRQNTNAAPGSLNHVILDESGVETQQPINTKVEAGGNGDNDKNEKT